MAGFIPKFYHDGAVDSWVHFPAAVGEYHIGMALTQTSGNLTKASGATKPTYICMAESKIENAGDVSARLAYKEEFRAAPFSLVWDYYCDKAGKGVGLEWLDGVKKYEDEVLLKR